MQSLSEAHAEKRALVSLRETSCLDCTAKVRHFSCGVKFSASNWADFQQEFERFSQVPYTEMVDISVTSVTSVTNKKDTQAFAYII